MLKNKVIICKTMNYQLDRGRNYSLVLSGSVKEHPGWGAVPTGVLKARYVMYQNLPSTGRYWETFFTYFGGTEINGSEGIVRTEGILMRVRVPAEGIVSVKRGRVAVNGELVTRLIIENTHTPAVQEWLREVEDIEKRGLSAD
jgi:hypothetical protein